MSVNDLQMQSNHDFLRHFIESKSYLQNGPLTANKFADYASDLGLKITVKNLEELEEQQLLFPIMRLKRPDFEMGTVIFVDGQGKEKWRYADSKPLEGEKIVRKGTVRQYTAYGFGERDHTHLVSLLNEGFLYDPQDRPFQPWRTFQGERLENGSDKIVSLYSSYQLHWLAFLKNHLRLEIDFTCVPLSKFKLENLQKKTEELKKSISWLTEKRKIYEKKYRLMLCLQSVYAPSGRSGSKYVQIQGDLSAWHNMRSEFSLKSVLDFLGMNPIEVAELYIEFCSELQMLLDVKTFNRDIIQLWKSMNWEAKSSSLEGNTRRGIEYLQWALSLKRALSDYLGRHVFDVDEIRFWKAEDIIATDPDTLKNEDSWKMGNNRRAARIAEYYDAKEDKNYYYHTYKRLFYLANELGMDYQPRIMVFVEGQTEMEAMRKLFEWRLGMPEHHGIEFFNINGISNFFGKSSKSDTGDGSGAKKLHSNFRHLISYNLNQWQIIPFIVADDEGGIATNILNGDSIHYQNKGWSVPKNWKFVWGIDDYNMPFGGNSFELANFSNVEIIQALKDVLAITVSESDVEKLRSEKKGIKYIQSGKYKDSIKSDAKVRLGVRLIELLIEHYQLGDDNKVHKRPVLKIFDRVMHLGSLNHPPISRIGELQNQYEILRALQGDKTGSPSPV